MTPQRRAVLEELRSSVEHPSAEELLEMVRRRLPKVSLSTIYRNMEFFASLGLVKELKGKGGRSHFDARVEPHYHMRCAFCGRIMDLPEKVAGLSLRVPTEICGNRVLEMNVELLIQCSHCRNRDTEA